MERLMENMPNVEAFRGPKVDLLASFSNSSNIRGTCRPAHGCVDQMGPLKILFHLPGIKLTCILEYRAYWNFRQGTSVMIFL